MQWIDDEGDVPFLAFVGVQGDARLSVNLATTSEIDHAVEDLKRQIDEAARRMKRRLDKRTEPFTDA